MMIFKAAQLENAHTLVASSSMALDKIHGSQGSASAKGAVSQGPRSFEARQIKSGQLFTPPKSTVTNSHQRTRYMFQASDRVQSGTSTERLHLNCGETWR
mmetsp:Transcript_5150/g.14502  ORF Transcript_5150/g.14502 Transcript_5150/m.14502 type:complete len:100 (+) Transcript_5150:266-565(+)